RWARHRPGTPYTSVRPADMSSSTSDLPHIQPLPVPPTGPQEHGIRAEAVDIRKAMPTSPPFFNRELSWLDFNERVLSVAENPATKLLDRLKFLAIYSQNLDEFFEVRVAGLKEQIGAGVQVQSQDGLTATEAIERIRERVQELDARLTRVFTGELVSGLRAEGVTIADWVDLGDADREYLSE